MNSPLLTSILWLIPQASPAQTVPATPHDAKLAFHELNERWGGLPLDERDRVRGMAERLLADDAHARLSTDFARSMLDRISPLRATSAPIGEPVVDGVERQLPRLYAALDRETLLYRSIGMDRGAAPTPSELMRSVLNAPDPPFASKELPPLRKWSGDILCSVEHLRLRAVWAGEIVRSTRRAENERATAISEALDPVYASLMTYLALFDGPELELPEDELEAAGPDDRTAGALLASGTSDDMARLEHMARSSVRSEQVAGTRALVGHGFDRLVRGDRLAAAKRGIDAYLSGVPHRLRYRALVLFCLAADPDAADHRLDDIEAGRLDTMFVPRLPRLRALVQRR